MKYLVIAEKPSVSKSIAKVIGAYRQEDGYLEGGDCVVSWCLGHLAEYAAPEHYCYLDRGMVVKISFAGENRLEDTLKKCARTHRK